MGNIEHNNDRELTHRIRRGDKNAFRELYEKYHRQLYYFAKRFLKADTMAEDAVQDIFIKLWDKRETLEADSSVKSFLFTMLKNHVLNTIRNQKTLRRVLESYKKISGSKQRNTTEDEMLFKEYKELVEQAMSDLSPAERRVFKMKNIEGMTNARIAEIRDVSVNTVKTQFYLSTKFIRNYLKKYADF